MEEALSRELNSKHMGHDVLTTTLTAVMPMCFLNSSQMVSSYKFSCNINFWYLSISCHLWTPSFLCFLAHRHSQWLFTPFHHKSKVVVRGGGSVVGHLLSWARLWVQRSVLEKNKEGSCGQPLWMYLLTLSEPFCGHAWAQPCAFWLPLFSTALINLFFDLGSLISQSLFS